MASNNGKRSNRESPFIRLSHRMLKSTAWASRSGNAVKVLLDLWRYHDGTNNGEIVYSAQEASDALDDAKDTGWRALNELVEHGFLGITRDATFGNKAMYALTMERAGGKPATLDFLDRTAGEKP